MHKIIFQEFEKICQAKDIRGKVLEVGATADENSLLNMKALHAAQEKTGINIDGPHTYKDFSIIQGNANSMGCFEDGKFDLVLCNSVLEHDKFFWKTLSEIKRVTKSGGIIVIGVPGYGPLPGEKYILGIIKMFSFLWPGAGSSFLANSAIALKSHDFPQDYYRFSEQVMRDVFFEGMLEVEVFSVMHPPRHIGVGIKP